MRRQYVKCMKLFCKHCEGKKYVNIATMTRAKNEIDKFAREHNICEKRAEYLDKVTDL